VAGDPPRESPAFRRGEDVKLLAYKHNRSFRDVLVEIVVNAKKVRGRWRTSVLGYLIFCESAPGFSHGGESQQPTETTI
jgi:hypothetical protein